MQNIEIVVKEIIEKVQKNGDDALMFYSEKFDNKILQKDELIIDVKDFKSELENISPEILEALEKAKENIEIYHKKQFENIVKNPFKFNGITEKISSIDRVGVYVPGGKYSYPSTVLMTVVPAKCANVNEVFVATPLKNLTPVLKAALYLSGADKVLCVGGAQAIAAMAFGTDKVEKVDMIVGPGNSYVTEAKRQVFGIVGIDMLAGPSDVMIYADDTVSTEWIVEDMNAQCEHDIMSKAVLISESSDVLEKVKQKIESEFLEKVCFIKKENIDECVLYINDNAPEHLEILTQNENKTNELVEKIKNSGAIFLGKYGTVSFGDVVLKNVVIEHLDFIIDKMKEAGTIFDIQKDAVRVIGKEKIKPVSIETLPYPGFPTDMQAQWMLFH